MTIGRREYAGGTIGDGGMYGYTNARMGNAAVRDCQVNSSKQPQFWGKRAEGEDSLRQFYGETTGETWASLDSKVISQNHMKINLAIESKALEEEKRKLKIQGCDKTTNEFATPAMSAFKNASYNPMKAPVLISEERLTFLQGLTPPPGAIRNPRLEADIKNRKEAKDAKRRQKQRDAEWKADLKKRRSKSASDNKSSRSTGSRASSVLSTIIEQQDDMRASLQEMRGSLSKTHVQLESLKASGLHPKAAPESWGHPYTTFNSARRNKPHPLDPLPSSRSTATGRSGRSLGSSTNRSALTTARSGASLATGNTGLSGYSMASGVSKATSMTRVPAAYGLYA